MDSADARHLFLSCAILFASGCDLICAIFAATKGEQVCQPLNPIHKLGLDVCALGDESLSRYTADDLGDERQDQTQSEEKAKQDKSNCRVEGSEEDGYEDCDRYCGQCGRDHANVEIFQSLHITDDARQQVSTFVFHQACWGEGLKLLIKPDAQAGEQTKCDVVRNEPLKIAEDAAADAEESHADHRDAETSYGRVKRGMDVFIAPEIPAGARYSAKVTVIDRLLDTASGTFGVRMELRNPQHQLPAGIRCKAEFAGVDASTVRSGAARSPAASPASAVSPDPRRRSQTNNQR